MEWKIFIELGVEDLRGTPDPTDKVGIDELIGATDITSTDGPDGEIGSLEPDAEPE